MPEPLPELLGLSMLQWITLVVSVLALFVAVESALGHVRTGFRLRAQYAPLVMGGMLAAAGLAATAAPSTSWAHTALCVSGFAAAILGLVGAGYHHWFGVRAKPGGSRFLLHYLMYGAPPLAPFALTILGALAAAVGYALGGAEVLLGLRVWRMLLVIVLVGLVGAIAQSGILHYRGSFNTPLMYTPLIIPPLAVAAGAWMAASPGVAAQAASRAALGLTFITGFVGVGMHLRGLDRQMGGLHVFLFNLLQGPPPFAPALFAGLAAVGLAAIELV